MTVVAMSASPRRWDSRLGNGKAGRELASLGRHDTRRIVVGMGVRRRAAVAPYRRLSEQLDAFSLAAGIAGKLLMTLVEQSVGHAALATVVHQRPRVVRFLHVQRAQSVMAARTIRRHHRFAHLGLGVR